MLQFLCSSAYWDYYLMGIILIPGLILGIYAQSKVSSTYNSFSRIKAKCNMTAGEVAKVLLESAGIHNVTIGRIQGHLTDNYNHREKTVSLSDSVYNSTSVAAIGITAHEIGHVLQYKTNYLPIKLRTLSIKVSNLSSALLWPLVFLGIVLNFMLITSIGNLVLWAGIIVFGLSVVVNLVTLPVEYNASKRATTILQKSGILSEIETEQAEMVLKAAALTYVASLVVSILNLLRFIIAIKSDN